MAAEVLTWIEADGVTMHPFDGSAGVLAIWGSAGETGKFAPPYNALTQGVPLQPGMIVRQVIAGARTLQLPTVISGNGNEVALRGLIRQMTRWLDPTRGPGILRAQSPDGLTQRDLNCYYQTGLEGDESDANRFPGAMQAVLAFYAGDPYWYDVNFTLLSFPPTSALKSFFPLLIPVNLSFTGLSTGFSIVNGGDDQTWPIWTITGPGTNPTLTNNTSGKVLTTTITLGSSDVLTIDTRPLKKTVVKQDGSNQFGTLSTTSALWPLVQGQNNIGVAMGGTGAGSLVQIQYKQRYWSA